MNDSVSNCKRNKEEFMEEVKNVRIFATSRFERDGINLYIDFSGQREYLMRYRFSRTLYNYLKRGIPLEELRALSREHYETREYQAMVHSVKHITRVADEFIEYEWLTYKQVA